MAGIRSHHGLRQPDARMATEKFLHEHDCNQQRISHPDPSAFETLGFVSGESSVRQLTLIQDLDIFERIIQ